MLPSATTTGTNEPQVNWQDYVTVIIRRRWFFIIPTVAIVVTTMVVGLFLPKVYRAETTLLVQDPKLTNPLIEGMAVNSPIEVQMQVVQEELLGWGTLTRLAHELGLDSSVKTEREREGLVNEIRRSILVLPGKSGNLLRLSYTSQDPHLAQEVLNKVTAIYIERGRENQTHETDTAIRVIEGEMSVYRQKLEESERHLREFKEMYAMDMPVAMNLNEQVVQLELLLAQMLVENTDEHPSVIQIRRQIQEFKARRNEELKRVVARAILKSQNPELYEDFAKQLDAADQANPSSDPKVREAQDMYHAWVERLDSPAATIGQAPTSRMVVSAATPGGSGQPGLPAQTESPVHDGGPMSLILGPRQEQEMTGLERDYEIHKATYEQLKNRLEQAKITQRLGSSDEATKFKIIEPARLPQTPLFPNLLLFFIGSVVVGLAAGTAAAFGAEYLDQSFQSAEDVQAALSLPVVGSISTIVTTGDVQARQERMKRWLALTAPAAQVKARVLDPVLARVDKTLLRWGL